MSSKLGHSHKLLVGGYNGGTKGLVSKATNSEKIGVCKTENLGPNKVWKEKTVEGREIVVHMMRNLREATSGMSQSERYDVRLVFIIIITFILLSLFQA